MATLQIQFNCLCMFVRDETNHVVHVLMPKTHPPHEHVVMLYHATKFPEGRRMHGLELVLGPADGDADLSSLATPTTNEEIVDVTAVSADPHGQNGKKVKKTVVTTKHTDVLTRVTLRGGKVVDRSAEAWWEIEDRKVFMAHQVTWEIDGVDDILVWNDLNNPDPKPILALTELDPAVTLPSGKTGYALRLFHTTPDRLPPNERGVLNEAQVRQHFRHYYGLLGHNPSDLELPKKPDVLFVGTFNCGVGQALLE